MHRFYIPAGKDHGPDLQLTGREAHHALHVLRLRRGETIEVLNGEGLIRQCQVEETTRDQLLLKVLEERLVPPLPYRVTLAQAIPKGKLFESILQKATELGAARIVPLLTERTIVQVEEAEDSRKLEKWRLVLIEAIKQCGSAWLPRLDAPVSVKEFVGHGPSTELGLVGSLRPEARHPRMHFDTFQRNHDRKPQSICVAVGPEGDFTDEELAMLQSAGALPITLGPLVLRTETAATYCLSIINYELQADR